MSCSDYADVISWQTLLTPAKCSGSISGGGFLDDLARPSDMPLKTVQAR